MLISGPGPFVLRGVPALEAWHAWVSVPVCLLYEAALAGHTLLLSLGTDDKTFWAPVYQLLRLLAATDLVLATSTVTKALAMLWGLSGESSFGACLAQLFITHKSLVLLAMTVDCYMASYQPLCYRELLTQHVVGIVATVTVTLWPCSRDCLVVGSRHCPKYTMNTWVQLGWHVVIYAPTSGMDWLPCSLQPWT